jgi:hypothetical protein
MWANTGVVMDIPVFVCTRQTSIINVKYKMFVHILVHIGCSFCHKIWCMAHTVSTDITLLTPVYFLTTADTTACCPSDKEGTDIKLCYSLLTAYLVSPVSIQTVCQYFLRNLCLMGTVSTWWVAVNIFNNPLQRASKWLSSMLRVMLVVTSFMLQKSSMLLNVIWNIGVGRQNRY